MGACSASFVRRGGCAAAACSRRNTALIATAIEDYAKGEPAGRVAAASPQLGGASALRTCARAGGRGSRYGPPPRRRAYWALHSVRWPGPLERERERLLPGYTRTDLKAISQLNRTVRQAPSPPASQQRARLSLPVYHALTRHRAACGPCRAQTGQARTPSPFSHIFCSQDGKALTPR